MRFLPLALVALAFSGCISDPDASTSMEEACAPRDFTLYLTPDYGLSLEPVAGIADGNGFVEAFLTNDMEEFRGPSSLLGDAYRWVMEGNFTYHLVVETGYAIAPIVSTSDPTTGYHFFNQFGTTQGFTPGYDVFYEDTFTSGSQYTYDGGWDMPPGGYRIEPGDEIRFLLTNLVLDDEAGRSPRINTHDSFLQFTARCEEMPPKGQVYDGSVSIGLPLNQGLLTGAIPASELNQAIVEYTLGNETKVQFRLIAPDDTPKDDVDMTFYHNGVEFWSGGSPYTNEVATLWRENLDALGITDEFTIEINGYSTINYEGRLEFTAWN